MKLGYGGRGAQLSRVRAHSLAMVGDGLDRIKYACSSAMARDGLDLVKCERIAWLWREIYSIA